MRGKFSGVDPEYWGKGYWRNRETEQMALINHVKYDREPADQGIEDRRIYLKYPIIKLLNIVTWDEWHALMLSPNDENEE
jgi:hypothetical protein